MVRVTGEGEGNFRVKQQLEYGNCTYFEVYLGSGWAALSTNNATATSIAGDDTVIQ